MIGELSVSFLLSLQTKDCKTREVVDSYCSWTTPLNQALFITQYCPSVSSPMLAGWSVIVVLPVYGIIDPYLCVWELQNSLCQFLTFASGLETAFSCGLRSRCAVFDNLY